MSDFNFIKRDRILNLKDTITTDIEEKYVHQTYELI